MGAEVACDGAAAEGFPDALEVLEGTFHEGDTVRVEREGDHLRLVQGAAVPEKASA